MADITLKGNITITDDGQTAAIAPTTSLTFDLTDPEKFYGDRQSLSTAYADISLGSVGWTDATGVTWVEFKNMSATPAEIITIDVPPTLVAGGTDDGTVAGASLAATLTATGYYKTISADGTSQGKTWVKGDIAVYLGTSGAYLQIRAKGFKLKNAETAGPFRVKADGGAWKAVSASGTPQLAIVAAGPLV